MIGKICRCIFRAVEWLLEQMLGLVGIYTWRMASGEKNLLEPIPDVRSKIDIRIAIASGEELRAIEQTLDETDTWHFKRSIGRGGSGGSTARSGRFSGGLMRPTPTGTSNSIGSWL